MALISSPIAASLLDSTLVAGLVITFAVTAFGVGGFLFVVRFLPAVRQEENNDYLAFVFSVMAGLYAILLAFVVVAIWQDFGDAKLNSQDEVTDLSSILRDAGVFDQEYRQPLRQAVLAYAKSVADDEWPVLAYGRTSEKTQARQGDIWQRLEELKIRDGSEEQAGMYQVLADRMNALEESRRLRVLQSRATVPMPLWMLLLIGGVLILGFTWVYFEGSLRAQFAGIAALSMLLGFVFFLVYALQHPFAGSVSVSEAPFLELVNNWQSAAPGTPSAL